MLCRVDKGTSVAVGPEGPCSNRNAADHVDSCGGSRNGLAADRNSLSSAVNKNIVRLLEMHCGSKCFWLSLEVDGIQVEFGLNIY
jgi:hypothetical protein